MKMKVAVVILNWNGEKFLSEFLPSVVECSQGEGVKIVVADNGSTDASQEVVKSFPTVDWLPLEQNYGFAEGYNRALSAVEAELFVLLNSDVEVTQGWLDALVKYMDEHPEVAACQPKIRSYHRRTFFEHAGACGGLMDEWGYPYCYGRMFDAVEEDNGQYELPMRIFWATGACLCIRSSCYHEVGGLDKDFFAHMEEIDLCWRLASRGWEVAYVPQSVVYHVGGGSLPKENPRKDYLNFRNNLLMLYKNLPKKRLWKVMMVRFFLDYMAALVFVLKGKWGSFRAVLKARWDYQRMKRMPEFVQKRRDNMEKMCVEEPFGIVKRCIVWDYHLRHKRS